MALDSCVFATCTCCHNGISKKFLIWHWVTITCRNWLKLQTTIKIFRVCILKFIDSSCCIVAFLKGTQCPNLKRFSFKGMISIPKQKLWTQDKTYKLTKETCNTDSLKKWGSEQALLKTAVWNKNVHFFLNKREKHEIKNNNCFTLTTDYQECHLFLILSWDIFTYLVNFEIIHYPTANVSTIERWSFWYGSWIYNYICNQCVTTKFVSWKPAHGEVYSIQHYEIKIVSDFGQVGCFLPVLWFPPPIKQTATI